MNTGPLPMPDAGWLTPTAALNRFVPDPPAPTDDLGGAAGEQPRYGFRVGTLGVLVPVDTLCEVIPQPSVFPLPKTPVWIHGLMNLRGNLVPVFDLHRYLGMDAPPGARVLLALGSVAGAGGNGMVGVYAEGLPQRVPPAPPVGQLPPVPEALKRFVQGAWNQDGVPWLDVAYDSLFTAMGAG